MSSLNILFTSAGRRVSLIKLFRAALDELGVSGTLVTADMQALVPARSAADVHEIVPAVHDPEYVDRLCTLCRRHRIHLIVPLIDTELLLLAQHRTAFATLGVTLLASSEAVASLTLDKRKTHAFFRANGIPTPCLRSVEDLDRGSAPFPVMVKPATGSGSVGVALARSMRELRFHVERVRDPIVQDVVEGDEYTLDILLDFTGTVRCVVPRKRIEVRAGEVSKAVTVRHELLIAEGTRIAGLLPGALGPLTLQGFVKDDGTVSFIEINPRFGGGFPLSAAAGANFPRWIIEWVLGRDPEIGLADWQDGMYMLRYDEGLFFPGDAL